jgi:hypothetical protein
LSAAEKRLPAINLMWIRLAEQSDQPPSVCSLYVKAGRPQLQHSRPQPSHVEQAAALARLLQV